MDRDYRIEELIRVMRMLEQSSRNMPLAKLDQKAISEGLSLSKRVCAQEPYVNATPIMKNLMVICGDVKQTKGADGEWHTEQFPIGKQSKALDWINSVVERALLKFNGQKREEYDHSVPILSRQNLNTDCWMSWLDWKDNFWDIKEGQAKEREEVFLEYAKPYNPSTEDVINMLRKDPCFRRAVLVILESLPEVRASREVREISDPFMSKKTGVSYPYYKNDSTTVPGSNFTYGEQCIADVEKAYSQGLEALTDFAYQNNVYTGYPRNQRKGRALEAQSRRVNLIINMLNAPEMEYWKNQKFHGAAFQDPAGIKAALVRLAEHALKIQERFPEYGVMNKDYSGWDRRVASGLVTLVDALRLMKTNGTLGRKIAEIRHNCQKRSYLVNGPAGRVQPLFGRTPSGYDDTTLFNTDCNGLITTTGLMEVDPHYSERVIYPTAGEYLLKVGDDICAIWNSQKDEEFVSWMEKNFAVKLHTGRKDAWGIMFIQYRLIKTDDGRWIMTYNWPRVLRSMLTKEERKGLGRGGWTLSFWQQLGKLEDDSESLHIVTSIAAALDTDHLMLDRSVDEIKEMVQKEDEERVKEGTTRRAQKMKRSRTTAEKLGIQPQFQHQVRDGVIHWDYFEQLQKKLREAYDPEFLLKLGFKNPDLSLVK